MIKTRRMKFDSSNIDELALLDPRLMVGVSVFPSEVHVIALNNLSSLQQKTTIILEETSWMSGIKIKSMQRLIWEEKEFLNIETDGPLSPNVKVAASKILREMKRMEIRDAFFPGEDVLKSANDNSLFYFGRSLEDLKIVDSFFTAVRVMPNYLIFYCQRQKLIKKLRLKDVLCDWSANSFGLCQLADVVFLGRIKNDIMPITLRDGRVLNMDVFQGRIVSEGLALEEEGIFIGEVERGINASIVADKLVLSPI